MATLAGSLRLRPSLIRLHLEGAFERKNLSAKDTFMAILRLKDGREFEVPDEILSGFEREAWAAGADDVGEFIQAFAEWGLEQKVAVNDPEVEALFKKLTAT